jgi:hypothetical protein
MMKSVLLLAMISLGAGIYLTGVLWPKLFPVEARWTNEKAIRLPEVNERLAQLSDLISRPISMHSGPDRGVAQRELQSLARERAQLVAEFEDAVNSQQNSSGPLKASGIAVATIGVAAWCWMRFRPARAAHDAP